MADKKKTKSNVVKDKKYYIKRTLITIGVCIMCFIFYIFAVDINLFGLFGKSPSIESIINPRNNAASELYSADGVLIGKFYNENRTLVKYHEINPVFWQALISTEDERFYEHNGIDFEGFAAAGKDFVVHGKARGASTITQQLVKNLFRVRTQYSTGLLGNIPGVKMLIMKTKEWITSVKLEIYNSKNEILTMYANTVDYGNNAFGIKTAARTYFNTTPDSLKTEEIAVLVGLLKGTTFYSPILNPENCQSRRNVVLSNMYGHGYLTKAECDSLSALPLTLHISQETKKEQTAQYFRDAVAKELYDWCEKSDVDLYADGLKIYTTLDSRMQRYAENAAKKEMKRIQKDFDVHWGAKDPWEKSQPDLVKTIARNTEYYKQLEEIFPDRPDSIDKYLNKPHRTTLFSYEGEIERNISTLDSIRYMLKFMHCSFVAIDPRNGYVKAWVGDVDYQSWKYDKVMSMRQPGSTFKLFVYTEAMNQGLTPNDERIDSPISMMVREKDGTLKEWAPSNATGSFSHASMTLMQAFGRSTNSIAAKLGQECGISSIARTAYQMGITSKLDETPSLALGASDVRLLDLTSAYGTIANGGKRVEPVLVTRIEDSDGNTIYTNEVEAETVLPARTVFLMQKMLEGGVKYPFGTSHSLTYSIGDVQGTDFGGKTGTTNNNSDGWFVGITPGLVCGAWVGGEYRSIHFRSSLGQGAKTALPLCAQFLSRVFHDNRYKDLRCRFSIPHDIEADTLSSTLWDKDYYYYQPAKADTLNIEDEADEENTENTEATEPKEEATEIKEIDFE